MMDHCLINHNKLDASVIKQTLITKLKDHTAKIGVIGLGYVGLPLAVEKAKAGYYVVGIDIDRDRVNKVTKGLNYISDVDSDELSKLVKSGFIRAYSDYSYITELDAIIVTVPTPLNKNLNPELKFIEDAAIQIAKYLRVGQVISLESTTYPGTTEEIVLPILARSGLLVDKDFFLVYSPERVDPGNNLYKTKNTAKIVGGVGPNSTEVGEILYSQAIDKIVTVSSAKTAELTKIFENVFRAVNIALVNELAMFCDRLQINVWEVLDAAFTKPFGIIPFYPGPGVGGHCIPLDLHYLEWKARELKFDMRFIALASELNRKMPFFVRERIWRILNRLNVVPSKASILVMGVAYKKDCSDYRESPALELIKLLINDGVNVKYHDPHIFKVKDDDFEMKGTVLTDHLLQSQDLVVITTDHSVIDYNWLVSNAKAILDTRNATKKVSSNREKIILL